MSALGDVNRCLDVAERELTSARAILQYTMKNAEIARQHIVSIPLVFDQRTNDALVNAVIALDIVLGVSGRDALKPRTEPQIDPPSLLPTQGSKTAPGATSEHHEASPKPTPTVRLKSGLRVTCPRCRQSGAVYYVDDDGFQWVMCRNCGDRLNCEENVAPMKSGKA